MKLGLLVVVAVAVVLPSFSESRIVSKCELKDKLGEMINLPRKSKEKILAIVICDVKRRSDLNTALVTSFGKCTNTTTSPTSTNSTISSVNTTLESNSTSSSEEDSSEEENLTPLSLSLYGLFQLSDRKFCDSGYCPSENLCNTSCTAFNDEDITDDIACVIQTGYWKEIEMTASESCRRNWNCFKECK
ncbi:lysozyme c-1-like isoform X2 [Simochromis diagramma]|nr:lysozyme c-1-like isoform X2 [Simochromis diagramma]